MQSSAFEIFNDHVFEKVFYYQDTLKAVHERRDVTISLVANCYDSNEG